MIPHIQKTHKHIDFNKLPAPNKRKVKTLSGILRIADGLDRGHSAVIKDIDISIQGSVYKIKVVPEVDKDPTLEVWGANTRKELFEESFGYIINISL